MRKKILAVITLVLATIGVFKIKSLLKKKEDYRPI